MYHAFFGLAEAPFSIAVNPRYLYMSPRHRDALAHLLYGVGAGGGFILLTGEVGTGKTTINRCLLEQLPDNVDIAMILNPALDARDLLASVCDELKLDPGESAGLKLLTDTLHQFLLENHGRGRKTVLMIDEAQHLSFDVLEQIRLLTNLETSEEKLLHIILIGQPELAEKLARPELRQLNQRITARFDLKPLDREETGAYIRHRLHVAGLAPGQELFSPSLVRAIHRTSNGVPRLINLLCERMLLGGYGQGTARLDQGLLRKAESEVLGRAEQSSRLSLWQWAAAGLGGLVLVGLALGAYLFGDSSAPAQPSATPAVVTAPVPAPVSQSIQSASTEVEASGSSEKPPEGSPMRVDPQWRLDPQQGAAYLAGIYRASLSGDQGWDLCTRLREPGLLCARMQAPSWDTLARDDRPALLVLIDDARIESRVLVLGIEQGEAMLATPNGLSRVPLTELGQDWNGDYFRLHRTLHRVERTLQRGDEGEDVRVVAALFADMDGQQQPLTNRRYDSRLEEWVKLFQAGQGLTADGVLGGRTLGALVLAAGLDLDNTAARRRFEAYLNKGLAVSVQQQGR